MDDETYEVSEPVEIPDGKHEAEITEVELNLHGEYEYIDIYFCLTDVEGAILKYGVPAPKQGKLGSFSKLGTLLSLSGFEIKNGVSISLSGIIKHLIGQKAEFKTVNVPKDINGQKYEFAEIVEGTISFLQKKL